MWLSPAEPRVTEPTKPDMTRRHRFSSFLTASAAVGGIDLCNSNFDGVSIVTFSASALFELGNPLAPCPSTEPMLSLAMVYHGRNDQHTVPHTHCYSQHTYTT
jgi:hypothetical protein